MITYIPTLKELPITEIVARAERLRPVDKDAVTGLIGLIEEYGFTTPVLVRKTRNGFVLIDGMHRIEAMRGLGREMIPVTVCSCTDDEAALMEAGQNLPGGMNALDDAVFLAAWRRAYVRLHPETERGMSGALARHGMQATKLSFAKIVADRRGVSERNIQRTVAAAEALDRTEITLLRDASRVTVTDLQLIGKLADPDTRSQVVLKLAGGNAKNAATALRQCKAERGEVSPVHDPVEAAFTKLLDAWSRAPLAAKKRFLLEKAKGVWEAQNKGASLFRWRDADDGAGDAGAEP